jgi:hypothetical protein
MVSEPRCPECAGKVSATATWCMHCGEDFPTAIDADSGRPVQDRAAEQADYEESVKDGSSDAMTVGLLVGVFGLVTLPFVTPPNMTLFAVAAAVGSGVFAARQGSLGEAVSRGGSSLAAAPFVLWFLSLLVPGTGSFSLGALVGPLVYAVVVSSVARQLG